MEFDAKPPKGMKTIICDGVPVGYVEDVSCLKEAARLAKEQLQSKGLWKETSKAQSIFRQARSFANAAAHIYEKDLVGRPRNPDGISPFVVNAAFSAEMYLKCLQEIYSEVTESHVLTALFKSLPNKVKDSINKNCKRLEGSYEVEKGILFKEHLKNINSAFVDWRYIYERSMEHVNIPQTIFVLQVLHETTTSALQEKT